MSSSEYQREVAKRVFADEFNESTHQFRESEDERAPNYTLLRTGDRANRIFAVGTVTETENLSDDGEYWRARVVDPTGTFFVYAGQYEPEAAKVIRNIDTPAYIAVVGKPNRYEPEDGDEDDVMMSIRAKDAFVEVDQTTRDNWVVETAKRTLERIENTDGEDVGKAETVYASEREEYREVIEEALEEM